ncbi:GntR family transcriptional regulator [Magnetospirillum gryphiswaldense]|uniref:Transcriptional regulator, GntR family n=1 Tax=Magnetospirillum gryphiswaldense TaxID=55518 RepID=A4TWR8_9PROT|nr:GntR family transcriptional regulator [Magnetospirillum gryphiswaldense]AVM73929.1 putative HTH-type transcriptional regulator YdfH [Magnetospirillum gryphiswaldense MSR-1]AVM77832.1 putative HTH-type transcriptional regulator YdfH [Magnetospirillum gryphiswaldense]CAM75075.1 transcriptional regulator, GntR family [Magnetospirillum gryphiswaldense MSR-1]
MAERVWLQLAAEIVSGGVSGGRRLDEVEQSNRLGVSRTPLRESLRQLAALGLVENRPHRGVVVADGVGPSLFQVLAELESACARSTALLLTGAQCRELALIEPEHQLLMPWLRNACGNSIMRSLLNTLWYPLLADTARHVGLDVRDCLCLLRDEVAGANALAAGQAAQAYVGLWAKRVLG